MFLLLSFLTVLLVGLLLHYISYTYLKNRILKSRKWDLNICCGETDGGGINVDIVPRSGVPNFELVENIYRLPYGDKQFATVLCSHTIEHVDNPKLFFEELRRVGREVVLLTPPLWDLAAALDIFEHQWIFLSFRTKHSSLPLFMRLTLERKRAKIAAL